MNKAFDPNEGSISQSKRARLVCLIRTLHARIGAEKEALSTALNKLRSLMSSDGRNEQLIDLVLEQVRKFGRKKAVFESRTKSLIEKWRQLPRLRS